MNLALLLLLSTIPQPLAVVDTVDVIEHNHVWRSGEHREAYHQLLFDDESALVDWRYMQSFSLQVNPVEVTFLEWDGTWRKVRAREFRETWTNYDREVLESERWPHEQRRKLRQQ